MPTPSEVSGSATVFGGEQITVAYKRPFTVGEKAFQPGDTEVVLVRELEINPSLATYLELTLEEYKLADFICDRPAGWSRALTVDSVMDVVEKAHALNLTLARRFGASRANTIETLRKIGILRPAPSTSSAPAPATS